MLSARLTSGIAVHALQYALLIDIVRQTVSAFHSSLLICTFAAPTVLVGLLAGVAVDYLARRAVLILVAVAAAAVGHYARLGANDRQELRASATTG